MENIIQNNFIKLLEESIINNWDSTAIIESSSRKETKYRDIAAKIAICHYVWAAIGLKKGDRIAILASNCSEWVEIFLSIVSGGYVAVILPNNLSSEQILRSVIHSECKIVYTEDSSVLFDDSTTVNAVINIHSGAIVYDKCSIRSKYCLALEFAISQIGTSVCQNSIGWEDLDPNGIESIVYSSGTTSEPKAVLHSIRFATASLNTVLERFENKNGDNEVCILPFFHVFGIIADVVASLCSGMRIVIVNDLTPNSLFSTLAEYKPRKFFATPLLLTKMLETLVGNELSDAKFNDPLFCQNIRTKLLGFFGGNLEAFITGGASLSTELEALLLTKIRFPLITLYGSTECGLVSISNLDKCIIGSAGEIVNKDDVRISSDSNIGCSLGEVQIRGNIFSGYYQHPEATKAVFTDDGWFKTGDLGYIDDEGNLFITGRCKDMLLTSNGENIYPEEIESTMNVSPFIKESILVQRGEKLYAIVVPDRKTVEADGLDAEGLNKKIDEAVREASKKLPGFTIISGFELRDEPLERTPKGSLKRYLYSDGIKEN